MIQDASSSCSSAPASDDDMEFEPTLSAEMAQVLGGIMVRDEEGEPVRDDELISSESSPYAHVPGTPPLRPQSGYPPYFHERASASAHEPPKRSGPPPLVRKGTEPRSEGSAEPRRHHERTTRGGSRVPQASEPHTLERRRARRELVREGDLLLGKLRIERVITEGLIVMADAAHVHLGTRAQVVLLSPLGRGFSEAQDHFMRTARSVAQMQSEHVAKVTEVGVLESGVPFLVAELAGNSDLAEVIRVRGPFAVTDAVDCAIQVIEALAEAHSSGVIHGNLRPSCLRVVDGMDGWPLIKVLGFGTMAQWFLNTTPIRTLGHRSATGSLPYLSPEQIRSPSDLDARTDIWSVGALLHEMLVAWPLYQAETPAALLAMIAADPPPAISALRNDVPRSLETVILRCLQKDRNSRFATVADLARALQPFASTTSQASIERIVRVTARNSAGSSFYPASAGALVHVRTHVGGPRPFEPKPQQKLGSMTHIGLVAAGVAVLGAAAGIGGAYFTAQTLKASSPVAMTALRAPLAEEDTAKPSSGSNLQTEMFAARPAPVKNVAPTVPASAAGAPPAAAPATPGSTAAQVAAAPATQVAAVPTNARRETVRVAVAVTQPKRPSALPTSAAALPDEAHAEKTDYSSTKKATDLFSDMK